ncbi:hypothetical protein BH23THE1_BH23THE1_33120 [soil metagenome]
MDVSRMSEFQYYVYKNKQYDIEIDEDYCDWKKNPHNLNFGELWMNNVAGRVPVPCSRCKADLETYNTLVSEENVYQLSIFDAHKSKLRQCCKYCLWSEYFTSRRHSIKDPNNNNAN